MTLLSLTTWASNEFLSFFVARPASLVPTMPIGMDAFADQFTRCVVVHFGKAIKKMGYNVLTL